MSQPSLFDLIAVHCFFGCGHVVREHDPVSAHDAMEQHYARHDALLSNPARTSRKKAISA